MTSWDCQWWHKQCQICHPTPLLQTFCTIATSRHIQGLPHISDERGQDIRLRHSFSLYEGGRQCIQGRRRPHNMQRGINPHRHTDSQGGYRIPLMHQWGHWQPQRPSKQAWNALRHANSVYNLPSTEQAIKRMHAVCGYPAILTWHKAIKARNYVGWPMLTERNIQKYYHETIETAKGHLNQTRKNVQSTKVKATPL